MIAYEAAKKHIESDLAPERKRELESLFCDESFRCCIEVGLRDFDDTRPMPDPRTLIAIAGQLFFANELQDVLGTWVNFHHSFRDCVNFHQEFTPMLCMHLSLNFSFDQITDTLLHECAHYYLATRSCQGRCGDQSCYEVFAREMGVGGHGEPWHLLTGLVEKHAAPIRESHQFDLGRRETLLRYAEAHDGPLPDWLRNAMAVLL